ncbi:MAG: hypothetical protein ACJAT2_001092 [Bacteriovoracaceae bacterium]|jgi:hypothetical protein
MEVLMLKTITLLLISLTTLLLMNTAHTKEDAANFRSPAVSKTQLYRGPAITGSIELI